MSATVEQLRFRAESWSDLGDVFTVYDNDNGPDSEDMPEDIWKEICEICKRRNIESCVVWIKPV